jgi:hypothetical protein
MPIFEIIKRSPFLPLVFLLGFSLWGLLGYAFWPKNLFLGQWEIKKSELTVWAKILPLKATTLPLLSQDSAAKNGKPAASQAGLASKAPPAPQYEYLTPDSPAALIPDTTRQRILLTGDSMTERLLFSLIKYCKHNQHEFLAIPIYSSTTQSLAQSDTLDKLINKFQPTLILLTLGSNELFIPKIKVERAKYVETILQKFKNCKFIWIGPPNWAKDTGINDLIISYVGKNRFFDSRYLTLARDKDGAHPTFQAGKFWADTLAQWVTTKSKYKIKMTPT